MSNDKIKNGYIEEQIPANLNLIENINKLRKEKNAVILCHYYATGDLQNIADFVGDSLALSQQAAKTEADIIVFLGVHFMAETAKILSPKKKVLMPDLNAGCSLADSCKAEDFAAFLKEFPDYTVISYVNTTAEVKALSDIVCTSSNAVQIVNSLPKDTRIVFGPDYNLGNYVASVSGREMVIWNGACHVHQQISIERLVELKKEYPDAKIIAHPECQKPVLLMADFIGATSGLLKFTQTDTSQKYIVATESGILHQMKILSPTKLFIPAPPEDASCGCSDCNFMKLNSMQKLYLILKYELPEIKLEEELMKKAEKPIRRMLEISKQLGL